MSKLRGTLKGFSLIFIIAALLGYGGAGHCQSGRQSPFDRDDRNGDGLLSEEEFRGPKPAFKKMDQNGDGYISQSEVSQFRKGKQGHGAGFQSGKEPQQSVSASEASTPIERFRYIDTHDHLAGWAGGQGSMAEGFEKAAETALKAMNRLSVNKMILMPTPQTVNQDNHHDIDDYLKIIKGNPQRFAMLAGGGTLNVMIQRSVMDGDLNIERHSIQRKSSKKMEYGHASWTIQRSLRNVSILS